MLTATPVGFHLIYFTFLIINSRLEWVIMVIYRLKWVIVVQDQKDIHKAKVAFALIE